MTSVSLSPSDALEKATELISTALQAHLSKHLGALLQWPPAAGTKAHDFARMLYVAEHGASIKLAPAHSAISSAMRGLIAYTGGLPEIGVPVQANLSILPGSVAIRLEDTGFERRLVCVLKVKAVLQHPKPSKISVVLDGRVNGEWSKEANSIERLAGVLGEDDIAALDAAMHKVAASENKGWTFPTWQTSYGQDGALVPVSVKAD